MYKRFDFEGDIHTTLDCVPLSVRRKLDLAMLKISLEGWQKLTHAERLTLCHLPVDTDLELTVYQDVMRAFCARGGVPLKPLDDPHAHARVWNSPQVPALLATRAGALGATLTEASWRALDEESRYALLKMAEPKRNPLKLPALLVELGLLAGPAPVLHDRVAVCAPAETKKPANL